MTVYLPIVCSLLAAFAVPFERGQPKDQKKSGVSAPPFLPICKIVLLSAAASRSF
jgi:hypothetical protein